MSLTPHTRAHISCSHFVMALLELSDELPFIEVSTGADKQFRRDGIGFHIVLMRTQYKYRRSIPLLRSCRELSVIEAGGGSSSRLRSILNQPPSSMRFIYEIA